MSRAAEGFGREERVRLWVEDEGPGPPAGFDPASSTGLGMRILRALLRGGGVAVDHSVPRTRFVATLPAGPLGEEA